MHSPSPYNITTVQKMDLGSLEIPNFHHTWIMAHLVGPFWVVKVKQVCIIRSNLIVNCQAVQDCVDIKKLLKLHQFLLEI